MLSNKKRVTRGCNLFSVVNYRNTTYDLKMQQ